MNDSFQGHSLIDIRKHDAAQHLAPDLASFVEYPVTPAADDGGLHLRLPQGLVADLVAGDDDRPRLGQQFGHLALAAANPSEQSHDSWKAHPIHSSLSSQFGP